MERRTGARHLTTQTSTAAPDRNPLRSLRERNVRVFFTGLWLSTIGTWAHNTAVVLLIRELGGNGLELGIAAACQFGPMLLLGLKAGAIADQVDRFERLQRFSVILSVITFIFGALVFTGVMNIAGIFAMTFLFGTASALENPTRRSFVTELVPAEQIGNILSLNTTVMTGARMVGPAIAALLATRTNIGTVFFVNGLSYFAVLASLGRLDKTKLHRVERAAPSDTPVRDGLSAILAIPELRVALALFAVVAMFGYNYTVGLPLLVSDRLGREPSFYGILLSAMSLGNVVGALIVARLTQISSRFVSVSGLFLGITLAALSLATSMLTSIFCVILFGIGTAAFANSSTVLVQQRIDPRMRSRALSLTSVLFIGSTPIGGPITGLIGDTAGAVWANLYGAIISIAASVIALLAIATRRTATPRLTRTLADRVEG